MDYQMVKMTELDEAASFNNDDQILLLRSNNDVNTINVKNLLLHSHTNKNILDRISINNNNELLIDGKNICGAKIDDTNKTNNTTYSSNKIEAIKEELNNNIANIDLSAYYTKTETDNKYALITHNHSITDITNLQKSLDNKSAINHKHTIADITDYTAPELSSYLPLSGGTMTGDITLSYNNAIKSKDNSNNSDTTQDLIKFGRYVTRSVNTQAIMVGNSDTPTISLGELYEKNYRVLNSNNFTSYCPSINDLDNYLSKSGGTMTGALALTQDKGIVSANSEGGTLLVETNSSVNVGKPNKAVNLNCSVGSVNGSMILTKHNSNYAEVLFMGTTGGTPRKNVRSCMKITENSDKYYPVFTAPSDGIYLFMAWGSVSNTLSVNKQQLCSSSQQSGVKPLYLSKSDEAVFCLWLSDTSNSGLSSGIDIIVMKIN